MAEGQNGMTRFAVLLPYFNPADYRSHARKLTRCVDAFRRAGLADDVFLTGTGKQRPSGANIIFWDDDCSYMWHKERLVNLAARRLPARYTHVVWADSDLIVGVDWAPAVAEVFREARVVQCFRTARYRTFDDRYSRCQLPVSSLHAGRDGAIGLAWGACRSLFAQGPGLFELGLAGGGDAIFGLGVLHRTPAPSVPWLQHQRPDIGRAWSPTLLAALDTWLQEVRRWLGDARAVAASADIEVLEHGPPRERGYVDRHHLLASLIPEKHLLAENGRVFRWTQAGLASIEPGIRAYFRDRREDDPASCHGDRGRACVEPTEALAQSSSPLSRRDEDLAE